MITKISGKITGFESLFKNIIKKAILRLKNIFSNEIKQI
jgi:hypothetical protein